MIDLLEPAGELAIEFFEGAHPLTGQAQAGFKVLLERAEHALHFAAAPRSTHFGVDEPDTEVGTDDPQVGIDEGAAIVAVELPGKPTAADGFLEAAQQRLGVSGQPVGGVGDQARVIIDDEAQMRGHRLGVQCQEWARGKVDHPQVVDAGGLESLGGTGNILAQQIAPALGVQVVVLQPAIDRREGRQSRVGLFPLPVEQFDGHSRETPNLFQNPLRLLGGEPPGFAPVGACFGLEALEAAFLKEVIPVFEGASGHPPRWCLALCRQGLSRGDLFERRREGPVLVNQVDNLLNQGQAPQGGGLRNRLRSVFHMPASLSHRCRTVQKQRFVGWLSPCGPTKNFRPAVAGNGSGPRAKCGGVQKENRASWTPSQMTAAGLSRARGHRKPCY